MQFDSKNTNVKKVLKKCILLDYFSEQGERKKDKRKKASLPEGKLAKV